MLNILINAYAVCPNMGSEPGMGWNWCVNLANYCKLYIITESEFRSKIESELDKAKNGESLLLNKNQVMNMRFYFNTIGGTEVNAEIIRKRCWNQGDWRFYIDQEKWQRKTLEIARQIIEKEQIDLIHHLNMIGFREPGYLWKIHDIPYVWGPVGGCGFIPYSFIRKTELKLQVALSIKNIINWIQFLFMPRVNKAIKASCAIVSAYPDNYNWFKKYKNVETVIIPETGCFKLDSIEESINRFKQDSLNVLWVGKFAFRKQLALALKTIAATKNKNIVLSVYGDSVGNTDISQKYHKLASNLGITNRIRWMGNRPNNEIHEAMNNHDVLLFTSINDATSTVVLEALSHELPVLCHDINGMGYVINDMVGRKVPVRSPKHSIKSFAMILDYWCEHRNCLVEISTNCAVRAKELSWDNKVKQMIEIYNKVINTCL